VIPSLNTVIFLMKEFGFSHVPILPSPKGDEQFRRGSRVVVYGRKD
jgi:hypothetical protein